MNGILWSICIMCLTTLGLMLLLKKIRQPYLIAYILAGILLGPYTLRIFTDTGDIKAIGEAGILLLMFFLGMEINIPDSRSFLFKPVIAQSIKIVLSAGFALMMGTILHLPAKGIILLAILFAFNSTAVVSEWLKSNNLLHTAFGVTILNMLVFQDILLAPVLTLLKVWAGGKINILSCLLAVVACFIIVWILGKIRKSRELFLPIFLRSIKNDHDLQVFSGLIICLGFGVLAESIGLSSALGSFIAGVYIGRVKALGWLEHSLKPFKVFFVSIFFVSIGLQLDIAYLIQNHTVILVGTFLVLVSNSIMSAVVFRVLKYDWRDSLYGGALLSQTGEFGILALSIASQAQIIGPDLFKTGLGITGLSLLLSTIWVSALQKIIGNIIPDSANALR